MNILWLSHNVPYPPKTGVLQRNYNLLKEAARAGDIYLLAFYQKAILPIAYDLGEATRELRRICRHVEIVPVPIDSSALSRHGLVVRSIFTRDPYSVNWLQCNEMRQRVRRLATRIPFDIVHFDTLSLAAYRDEVGDVRTILNHHNVESHLMARRSRIERNVLKRAYYTMEARKLRTYEARCCGDFDVNFAVSDSDRALLSEAIPADRIAVIPNGVDVDYFTPEPCEPAERSLVFVGGMNWYPNRDAVLHLRREIWPMLTREIPDISLTIVGAQPPEEVTALAREDGRVRITGFVDDVRPYLRRAMIYVCPMRDGGGTRLKILDALAMGKPIVSTTLGCEGISVEPGKHVLLADTPSEFVMQTKALFDNDRLRAAIVDGGPEDGRDLVFVASDRNSPAQCLQRTLSRNRRLGDATARELSSLPSAT